MRKSIKILFLAANPQDADHLKHDQEIRGIKHSLLQAESRDKFILEQEWAVRVADIQSYFLRHKPNIVHFSGHGSLRNELIFEDGAGNSLPVPLRAIGQLFSVLKDNIRCVVLNACYSEPQAQEIAKHIDCVIGMSSAINDSTAISFSRAFYQALGFGKDVKTAFDLGCLQLDLERLDSQDIPKLLTNFDPKKIVLINELSGSSKPRQSKRAIRRTKKKPEFAYTEEQITPESKQSDYTSKRLTNVIQVVSLDDVKKYDPKVQHLFEQVKNRKEHMDNKLILWQLDLSSLRPKILRWIRQNRIAISIALILIAIRVYFIFIK